MRLFLDAHVSGRAIARGLRAGGHDVRAADEERALDGSDDEALLELAASESRIMVTFNARDFAPIVRTWAGEDRHHAGCAILVSIDHSEFGTILKRIEDELAWRPSQQAWQDDTALTGRHAPARCVAAQSWGTNADRLGCRLET